MEKFPWNSMEIDVLIFHGIPWRIFHGNPWNSMEFHGGFSHGTGNARFHALFRSIYTALIKTFSVSRIVYSKP